MVDKLLVILASNSEDSINRKVFEKLDYYLKEGGLIFSVLKLIEFKDIPILVKESNIPKQIKEICGEIEKYKRLVIFAPEHNGYFSAFFKNILDWLSLENRFFLKEKKIILISVSKTAKEKRVIEDSAKNSLKGLGVEDIKFINFNNYSDESINSERISSLSKLILEFN